MSQPSKPPAAQITPIAISDASAFASIGLTSRQFRKWLVTENVPHRRIGRRTLALVEDVRRGLGATETTAPSLSRGDLVLLASGRAGR